MRVAGLAARPGAPYPASTMARARELAALEFRICDIRRIIQRETGRRPSQDAVRRWIDDDYRERKNAEVAARQRAVAAAAMPTFRLPSDSPEYQVAFIARLRAERVTWENVARVCRVVFGGHWTTHRVKQLHDATTTEAAA